jgi:phosphoglycolate phosphatase-like HAD superfamily hydrolase
MFEDAAREFDLRLGETSVVGDSPSDMLAASRIGALGVLVAPGVVGAPPPQDVDYVASDLAGAARWLLGEARDDR